MSSTEKQYFKLAREQQNHVGLKKKLIFNTKSHLITSFYKNNLSLKEA